MSQNALHLKRYEAAIKIMILLTSDVGSV